MFAEMNATTVIPTDLVTPLGAYLRLRPDGGAAFLLESVEHGRLGRHSFVGFGTRIVGFEDAESLDEPVVGYLGYDHVARLEPTVPLPDTGPEFPESLFVVADTLDHAKDAAEAIAVAWEPLPHVIGAAAALASDAPPVWGTGNLAFETSLGDAGATARAFAAAARTVSLDVVNQRQAAMS